MAASDSPGDSATVPKTEPPAFPSSVCVPLCTGKLDQLEPSPAGYADFLKWYEHHQNSDFTAFVAHTSNSFACLSQFTSLRPWVLDSTAIDHISGSKALLSSLSTSGYLPTVTLANGFKM